MTRPSHLSQDPSLFFSDGIPFLSDALNVGISPPVPPPSFGVLPLVLIQAPLNWPLIPTLMVLPPSGFLPSPGFSALTGPASRPCYSFFSLAFERVSFFVPPLHVIPREGAFRRTEGGGRGRDTEHVVCGFDDISSGLPTFCSFFLFLQN